MELVLDGVVTAVVIAVLGQYAWSGNGHFSSARMPLGSILITVTMAITALLYLFFLWTGAQPATAQVAGLLIMVAGGAMFWFAIAASRGAGLHLAFDEDGPRSLVARGPYRYVRHPFYTSYLIFWSGFALATWSWVAILPLAIIVAIYTIAARMEEQKFASSPMAADYAAYRARTGLFWPRLG